MNQVCTISIFRIARGNAFWALQQMGRLPGVLPAQSNARFIKLMGSGRGSGFSIWPNWRVYVLLAVWDSTDDFVRFQQSDIWKAYQQHSDSIETCRAKPYKAHGEWEGQNPFTIQDVPEGHTGERLVLTRATIKGNLLHRFWQHVPHTSRAIQNATGVRWALGIGELPLIQQATISLWESEEDMKQFAYRGKAHQEAITKTRRLGWYREEMFVRFFVEDISKEVFNI